MSTRALAADGEAIVSTDTYVSSALGFQVRAFLPKINDGTAGTVAVDTEIRVEATGAAPVVVLTNRGALAGVVPGRSQGVFIARAGQVQGEADSWLWVTPINTPSAFQAVGATYAQAEIQGLRQCLIDHGLMKAE